MALKSSSSLSASFATFFFALSGCRSAVSCAYSDTMNEMTHFRGSTLSRHRGPAEKRFEKLQLFLFFPPARCPLPSVRVPDQPSYSLLVPAGRV